ncbi:glycoside hydrolase family 9 protein [Actinopolymorpha sp. B11F2]|uniref:glycoside hydrolase family 9 protein n=1 Tax=Actinopolymorpha sp. B11F2 TaxID=3160862 RepID=UPI0032E4CDD6
MIGATRRYAAVLLACALPLTAMAGSTSAAGAAEAAEAPRTTTAATAAEGTEQVENGGFDDGTDPWWWTGNAPAEIVDGRLCTTVPGGTANPWDVIVGQNGIALEDGASYTLSFTASASSPVTVRTNVQLADPPYTAELSEPVELTGEAGSYTYEFTSGTETTAGSVQLQVGGAAEPWTFCLDDVSLRGGGEPPVYVPDTGPRVRVNQVGYLPDGPKNATVVTDATDALPWQLRDANGRTVAEGSSTPRGVDAASEQNVATIDFSSYRGRGSGYTLTVDGETSYPFVITDSAYERLRSDSLQFFYIQRSGIPIDGALVGEEYTRPAGHVGIPPNQGDTDVPCQDGVCDYTLDVHGGWYDAGDHGKYVVNGGIAAHQLLSTWERAMHARTGRTAPLGDGRLRVPERGNGVPDILDEARWEVEFLLRMQVPSGQPLAGMAHHKMHDQNWTGLPLQPEADPQLRELHPPSTAATLNLAAAAAQCARVFKPYDREFARRCLGAAKTAWAAAKAHPDIYADDADSNGGGAYGDPNVDDEFYWAAAELYLTTGEPSFHKAVLSSPMHDADVFSAGGFSWGSVGALGRLQLATVPSRLPTDQRREVHDSVVAAADRYLDTLHGQAYGLPLPGRAEFYNWGSNSGILNNVVVLATAYDLTGRTDYRDGALQGVDYIFGRNALNHSYVTDYGTKSPQNQHSRIFGHQLDPNTPKPPAGSLAGGANAALQDPFAAELLAGCAPQFCYVDHIESYATNEVAINWNSALAWVASFLADQGGA